EVPEVRFMNPFDDFEFTTWRDSPVLAANSVGIMPMSSNDPICTCCRRFRYNIAASGNVRITGTRVRLTGALVIPDNLRITNGSTRRLATIEFGAFSVDPIRNHDLTSVVIPATVTRVGAAAFANNARLATVTFRGTSAPTFDDLGVPASSAFFGTRVGSETQNGVIRAPFRTLETYRMRLGNAQTKVDDAVVVGGRTRFVGICRISTTIRENCTCCRYRRGSVNGSQTITVSDALQVQRYVGGLSNVINNPYNANALNAALITSESRRVWQVRQQDADEILRFLVGTGRYLIG
ncbi:MAG: leucine-rich repeat domain-containing protein, partial [Oscillospiraceae bacterium]|nr:leucine-rich repeat domain-containing protein [Oscillospiraceae bacterium]